MHYLFIIIITITFFCKDVEYLPLCFLFSECTQMLLCYYSIRTRRDDF